MKKLLMTFALGCTLLLTGCAGSKLTLSADTFFDSGSSTIKPSAIPELKRATNRIIINALTVTNVIIEGNTDNVGGANYNERLSERRAQAVADQLVYFGIPRRVITIRGNGERQPVASNSTASGRALNRRVDIICSGCFL